MTQVIKIVIIPCGCQCAAKGARGPVVACAEHRYITCTQCGGRAEVSPIGTLCLRCTFGRLEYVGSVP